MKNIKMLVLTMVCAMGVFSALAQNNEKVSFFNANEFSIESATTYNTSQGNKDSYNFNADVGASYFLTRYIGVQTILPIYANNQTAIDRISLAGVIRVPINRFAPYCSIGSQYVWADRDFNYYGSAGLAVRVNSKWGIFGEYKYAVADLTTSSLKNGAGQVRAGISLVF